jgi:hypothetical protein
MPIRKMYDGEYLIGRVVEDSKEKWRVELDDETYDYLTTSEITQGRHGKNVTIGYRFKLTYEGKLLTGQVVDLKPKTVWRVDFIDGSSDHLELSELCRVRQFRNHLSAPSNGRQMCGFELCCGEFVTGATDRAYVVHLCLLMRPVEPLCLFMVLLVSQLIGAIFKYRPRCRY